MACNPTHAKAAAGQQRRKIPPKPPHKQEVDDPGHRQAIPGVHPPHTHTRGAAARRGASAAGPKYGTATLRSRRDTVNSPNTHKEKRPPKLRPALKWPKSNRPRCHVIWAAPYHPGLSTHAHPTYTHTCTPHITHDRKTPGQSTNASCLGKQLRAARCLLTAVLFQLMNASTHSNRADMPAAGEQRVRFVGRAMLLPDTRMTRGGATCQADCHTHAHTHTHQTRQNLTTAA